MIVALALATLVAACNNTPDTRDLCERTFVPYPDLVTGRVVIGHQKLLLSGMEAYGAGDYAKAVEDLEDYLKTPNKKRYAHLYLASSYLALGKPFEAELHLDHLENSTLAESYRDQTEWYTVVCWVCSGQLDRALAGARRIAEGRRHTYQREAEQLVKELGKGG
jgi:tetratricopeptide (TPR) repeat protein